MNPVIDPCPFAGIESRMTIGQQIREYEISENFP
jgi:hypothetical protein